VPDQGELTLRIELQLGRGLKLNPEAQMSYLVETMPEAKTPWSETKTLPSASPSFSLTVPAAKLAGSKGLRFSLVYYECGATSEALCRVKSQIWDIPLKLSADATNRVIPLLGVTVAKSVDKLESR
jgi:hypothetical protein